MLRVTGALLAGLLLVQAGAARADDAPLPAGSWKVILPFQGGTQALWLVKLSSKEGKWTGTAINNDAATVPEATVENISVTDGVLHFTLKGDKLSLPFEAVVPKNGDKILGTVTFRGKPNPARLEKTALASLDAYEVNKEIVATQPNQPEAVRAALELLTQAADKKAKPEEVRGWADNAVKWAEPYGPVWGRDVLMTVAETLIDQDGFAPVALEYARKAEKGLDPAKDKVAYQRRVLRTLATALKNADKQDEAKDVEARLEKIPPIVSTPYAGRKGASDRVMLVEMFTGAQCPPCVAADMAFDGLTKTYKPGEVILLQYHLHIPGPDPLTNADTEERYNVYNKLYGNDVRGTPTLLVNGEVGPPAGGFSEEDAQKDYDMYTKHLEPLLEKPAKVKLKTQVVRKDGKYNVKAEVSDLEETGNDVRLRLVLVEEQVAYTGGNKIPTHHHVVRGFPGGVEGTALPDKTGRKVVTIDPDEVRKGLQEYVDKNPKDMDGKKIPYPGKLPAIDLKKLRLVAFVQNDKTGEVLQAQEVDLPAE